MLSKKTVVFLAALLALLLVANRMADRLLAGRGPVGVPPSTLLRLRASTPWTAVSVSNAGSFVRAEAAPGGRWNLVSPEPAPADVAAVALVMDTVARAPVMDVVTARQRSARNLSVADYGFAPPRASVVLGRSGEAPVLVEFGSDTPGGGGVFARVDGSSDIFAVERAAFDALPASADEFRDRILFVPPGRTPAAVAVRDRERGKIRLEAAPGGLWAIREPYVCPAAPSAVEPLVRSLSTAVAERFVPAREAVGAGLSPDETELVLSLRLDGEARDRDFAFGSPDPAAPAFVYASSLADGVCFTVDRTVLDALKMPLDVLRDHRILPYGPDDLRSVAFESVDGIFELSREGGEPGGGWTISRPSAQPADQAAAEAFLGALLSLRDTGAEFAPTGAPPALTSVRLSLVPFPPLAPERFVLAADPPTGAPTNLVVFSPERSLRRFTDPAAAPPAVFVPSTLAALRSKTILALPADGVSAETPALAALLSDFRARAVATLFPSDSAAYGLLPPRLERTVRTGLPDRPVVILQLGAALPDGGAYLRVKGADEIFEIDPEAVAILSAGAEPPADPAGKDTKP